jgi:replicative DNA helicase
MKLSEQERTELEESILTSMLHSETAFFQILHFGIEKELFTNLNCAVVFELITDFWLLNKKRPDIISLYKTSIGKDKEIRTFITTLNALPETLDYLDPVKALLDDNCRVSINNLLKETEKSDSSGIELALEINDKMNSFINIYYKKYTPQRGNFAIAEEVIQNIQNIRDGKTSDYIPTGFKYLDKKIIGFHKKSISTIAARPGMGKTALLLQLKRNLTAAGYKVGIISLEMDSESLFVRDLSAMSKIDSMHIESGRLSQDDYENLKTVADDIASENYFVDDSPKQTVKTVMNTINRWKLQDGIDIVFLDYLTLLKSAGNDKYNRFDLEIGKMTEELRVFSKETGTPIVIISQLNREVEKRNDKRPQLADLRESGSIEQDSRLVMFLYRPYYYGIDYTKEESHEDYYTDEQKLIEPAEYLEIIVAKNRGGLTGRVPLQYLREVHTFKNLYKLHDVA